MKPVFQTRFHHDGNCLSACIASILEVPLERVDFIGEKDVWLERCQKTLKPFGLFYLGINITEKMNLMAVPENYCIFTGRTHRNPNGELLHCVVGQLVCREGIMHFKTVHDPNIKDPNGLIRGRPEELGFLIPFDVSTKPRP